MPYGPFMSKLIVKFVPVNAIPKGSPSPLMDGMRFFSDKEYRTTILAAAERDALKAVELIRAAPDNPFGLDEEKIAEGILGRLKDRKGPP